MAAEHRSCLQATAPPGGARPSSSFAFDRSRLAGFAGRTGPEIYQYLRPDETVIVERRFVSDVEPLAVRACPGRPAAPVECRIVRFADVRRVGTDDESPSRAGPDRVRPAAPLARRRGLGAAGARRGDARRAFLPRRRRPGCAAVGAVGGRARRPPRTHASGRTSCRTRSTAFAPGWSGRGGISASPRGNSGGRCR